MGLNAQAWRTAWKKAKRERRERFRRACGCRTYVHTHASRGARRKGSKKLRAVLGRSVKCLNKRAIILTRSGISGVFQPSKVSPSFSHLCRYLGPPGSPRVPSVSFLLSFLGPPPKMSSAGLQLKSTRHAFHSLPVLSPGSPLCPADSDRQPFPALSLSVYLYLYLSHIISSIIAIARRRNVFMTRIYFDSTGSDSTKIQGTNRLNSYVVIVLYAGIFY